MALNPAILDELEGRLECRCTLPVVVSPHDPSSFRIQLVKCPLCKSAPDLLKVARPMADIVDFILLATPSMPAERKRAMEKLLADARAAIAKAEGR